MRDGRKDGNARRMEWRRGKKVGRIMSKKLSEGKEKEERKRKK